MEKIFYQIKKLGLLNVILYILLYPLKYVRGYYDWSYKMRVKKRSNSVIYNYRIASGPNRKRLSKKRKNEIKSYYKKFGLSINTRWHDIFFAVSGRDSNHYISEYHFYQFVEPHFNDMSMERSFSDKNMYSRHFPFVSQPKTIVRYIRNSLYSESYQQLSKKKTLEMLYNLDDPVIIKPSVQSGSGRDVNILMNHGESLHLNERPVSFIEILHMYKSGFIIQEKVNQHDNLKALYPDSLNTVKLVSFRYQDKIKLLTALFRTGNHGHYLDNMHQGGFCCGIQPNGNLQDEAYNRNLQKVLEHPFTNIPFGSVKIPKFNELVHLVYKLHEMNLYCDIASWDFGIDKTGIPILIETNLRSQGIFFQQLVNGPLFGDDTDTVLNDVFLKKIMKRSAS